MTKPQPKEREVWLIEDVNWRGRSPDHLYFLYFLECAAQKDADFFNDYYNTKRWKAKKYILTEAKE